MIHAVRAVDSFVAPTLSRPEFFNSLSQEETFLLPFHKIDFPT
jgi:hypothetical protein